MSERETFRDRLLARYEPVVPKLDELRRQALPPTKMSWRALWAEFFQPQRTAWQALVFIWLGLAAMHFATLPTPRALHSDPAPAAFRQWLAHLETYEAFTKIYRRP